MPISDAQYEAWLKADGKRRAMLVEAKAYSGAAETTRYFAYRPFVSRPTDAPANTAYDDIVADVPVFSARLSELFGGRAQATWGDIVVSNENGARDSWLDDGWDGRALTLLLGDPAWPRSDFRPILTGVSAGLVAQDRNRLALRVRDKSWATNVPLQKNLIGGITANKDKPIPICYGEAFNIEPALVTAATLEYQVHDSAIEDITDVRDNGLTVAYTKDLANGKFTLSAAPAGRITCDARGARPGGVYLTRAADIVQDLILTRTALTAADIDSASVTAMNATCPQKIGFFAKDFMSVGTAIDEIVTSVGGFWTDDALSGKLVLGRFGAPAGGNPALEITADDVGLRGVRVVRQILPVKTYRLGYRHNATPQSDGLAGAVTAANRALYAAAYQTVSAVNAGVETKHLLAESPDQVGTLLANAVEAQTEVNRRATLWSVLRKIYEVPCFAAPFKVRLGQVVRVTYPRFGFAAGKLAIVIGLRAFPTRGRVVLELFA